MPVWAIIVLIVITIAWSLMGFVIYEEIENHINVDDLVWYKKLAVFAASGPLVFVIFSTTCTISSIGKNFIGWLRQ